MQNDADQAMQHLRGRFDQALDSIWDSLVPTPGSDPGAARALGLAVSGGGDSVALLLLAVEWAAARQVGLRVVTVDHGLRPESADEARSVAHLCARLGLGHDILCWRGWSGQGNLQDAARRARQRLIAGWAQGQGQGHSLAAVALGHTRDDQAETFLMGLARGAGVDGLSGMAPVRQAQGVVWARPLLGVGRSELRGFLRACDVDWAEDPGNDDPRFQRVRARRALEALAPLGIAAQDLADAAARMTLARAALARAAVEAARQITRVELGDVLFERSTLMALSQELRERLMAAALRWVGAAEYPPRRAALRRALAEVTDGRAATLHGCLLLPDAPDGWLRVAREHAAVAGLRAAPGALWDGRWRLAPLEGAPADAATEIAALGEAGLHALRARAEGVVCEGGDAFGEDIFAKKKAAGAGGHWRRALLAQPAVWAQGRLLAAPVLAGGEHGGWCVRRAPGAADFHALLFSH